MLSFVLHLTMVSYRYLGYEIGIDVNGVIRHSNDIVVDIATSSPTEVGSTDTILQQFFSYISS